MKRMSRGTLPVGPERSAFLTAAPHSDHVDPRLYPSVHARHDARADVEILGLAVEKMCRVLGLDPAFTGIRTHLTILPLRWESGPSSEA